MGPTAELGKIQAFPSGVSRDPAGGGDSGEKRVESGVGEWIRNSCNQMPLLICDLREGGNLLVPWGVSGHLVPDEEWS